MNSTINFRNWKSFFFKNTVKYYTIYKVELQIVIFIISLLAIELLHSQQIQGNFTIPGIVFLLLSVSILGSFVVKSLLEELRSRQVGRWQGRVMTSPHHPNTPPHLPIAPYPHQNNFLDQIPVGLMLLGANAEILLCNAMGCKLLHRSEQELLGTTAFGAAWQVIQADGTKFANPKLLLSPQENLVLGIAHPQSDELMWLLVNTQPQDSAKQVICTFSNITARQSSEVSLRHTQSRLEQQNQVLLALAKRRTLAQGNLNTALGEITEAAASTLGVERVSVWLYNSDRSKIYCLNLYEQTPKRHSCGAELAAVDFPAYFQALETERTIAASDAYTDPRTCEFSTAYLPAVGVTSMLDAPIWLEGEMIGVVCHEYTGGVRHWTIEEQNFAGCIADLVILAMEADRRQKAQRALRQSEAKFHKLTAHMPGMIYQFIRHPDGSVDFPYASSYCREMFELEPEQMQQNAQLVLGQIHPDDRQSLDESIASSAQTLQPWRWEGRFITPSGKLKWLSGASRPEKLANGGILWDGLLMDITERKRTEAALAKRERYLAILVEVQRRLLADDTDGNCYAHILEQLGQTSGASRVYLFENHTDETGRLLASQHVEWCAKGIKPEIDNPALQNFPLEKVFPCWTEAIGRGEIIAGIVSEFPEPKRRILASRKVLSILVLPLIVNNEFWGFIGFDNCQEARLWDSLEVDLLAAAAAAIALHQERALAEKALFQAKDELEIQVEKRTKALRDTNQQLLVEIAERTAAERALQISLENLKKAQAQLVQSEKMSSLGQMVAGIAHEINNPIGFIVGNLGYANEYISDLLEMLYLYQEHYPQPVSAIVERSQQIDFDFLVTDLPKLLESMQSGAKRISDIVVSLRNFSRLDEAEMKRVNLHEGIDNTLLILQHRLKYNSHHPEIQIIKEYGELPNIECYPGKLNQVFFNILNNAIDAIEESLVLCHLSFANDKGLMTKDKGVIRICTELSPAGNVRIRIADNGLGMSEQVKARVFDPFFTTKSVGSGTGLGLTISYQIVVKNHRGVLNCTSELGQGTEFCIEIPISQTN
jgi:signal transduction histidine kinase/PAS domain-containing protein